MILIAFTNYDQAHQPPMQLVDWVGLENFTGIFSGDNTVLSSFGRVLGWTMIWAVSATLTCYFGGIFLALLINKKSGITPRSFMSFYILFFT